MSVTSNIVEVRKDLDRLAGDINDAVEDELLTGSTLVAQNAGFSLVGTGALPRRIDTKALQGAYLAAVPKSTPGGMRTEIDSDYALIIEEGTQEIAPGLHLTTALTLEEPEIAKRLSDEIVRLWG